MTIVDENSPNQEQVRRESKDGDLGLKAYMKPELKQFGPMRDLTKLGDGPTEDFVAYGGPS